MSGRTRRKATSVLGKNVEKLDADRPARDEHDPTRGPSRPVRGRFILAIPSSGLSAAGVIIRGVIDAETRERGGGHGRGDGMVGLWNQVPYLP